MRKQTRPDESGLVLLVELLCAGVVGAQGLARVPGVPLLLGAEQGVVARGLPGVGALLLLLVLEDLLDLVGHVQELLQGDLALRVPFASLGRERHKNM